MNRLHIAFFGLTNSGKSTLVNAICGQEVSLVSAVPGTTTDPVRKVVELPELGPCVLIDTAGIDDDQATVGELRVRRAREELRAADIAVVVTDPATGFGPAERALAEELRAAGVAFQIGRAHV